MVAANIARHLRERFADQPASWRPLVYCWRGGMRSSSVVQWLRLVGWDAQQLAGGYKAWRRHAITLLETICPQLPLRVLCGPTGSAKTRILHALARQGAQVIDLEGCARHRGSVLGTLPGVIVHGHVADIDPYMDGGRIAIAPLRYGAGVKGKVNLSMAHGQPVVATSCAVEGMHLRDGEDVLVADDPQAFADAVVRLHQDEALWNTLAQNGLDSVARNFSLETARATVRRVFLS